MKQKIVFLIALLISILVCKLTLGVCTVAPPGDASYCEYDNDVACCVVEYQEDGMTCYEVWCYWYHECEWSLESEPLCD